VPPLSTPEAQPPAAPQSLLQAEAVALFIDRARLALPSFDLTSTNAAAIAQICRHLDGLPLAIELAAARVKLLRVDQIAARLAEREGLQLLTGGARAGPARHHTLLALIDWSYQLLPDEEQALLRRLAIFTGHWNLEAAEAVGAREPVAASAVLDGLTQLVNKSLVVALRQPGAEARYHLLETIHQYALAKLDASGELDALRQRHLSYYLPLAATTTPAEWAIRYRAAEADNLRSALRWGLSGTADPDLARQCAAALRAFWPAFGYTEARFWLEAALGRLSRDREQPLRAGLLDVLGMIATIQGDYDAGQAWSEESLRVFQELGDRRGCAAVLERLGWAAREQGDAGTARQRLAESLALYRELGDQAGAAQTLNTLGAVAIMQEDAGEAARLLTEALALNQALGDPEAIGWSLNHLGQVAQLQGEYAAARRWQLESVRTFQKMLPHYIGVGEANYGLGEIALAQGEGELAAQRFREALDLLQTKGARAQITWCLSGLAGVALLEEDPERAVRLWGAAEALRQALGCRPAPAARATRERLIAAARQQLGDVAFEAAWATGEKLTLEQAIALPQETASQC
jgi:hypothetical protein